MGNTRRRSRTAINPSIAIDLPCAWLAVLWSLIIVFGGVNIVWVVPLAGFVVVGVRILRVRVTADDDALRIRNPFRNYQFDWTDVVDIEIDEVADRG